MKKPSNAGLFVAGSYMISHRLTEATRDVVAPTSRADAHEFHRYITGRLTKSSGNVIFSFFAFGVGEDGAGFAEFDQVA